GTFCASSPSRMDNAIALGDAAARFVFARFGPIVGFHGPDDAQTHGLETRHTRLTRLPVVVLYSSVVRLPQT
ncbi:MAG TPA: hypothetical protein PKE29_18195, partial [Phycisphaerales bacterium]|nr:hypothetical protein [Phycisphaerales bacterium]